MDDDLGLGEEEEEEEDEHLVELFQSAADHLAANIASIKGDATRLQLYGLYKQSTSGACSGSRPSFWQGVAAQAKW